MEVIERESVCVCVRERERENGNVVNGLEHSVEVNSVLLAFEKQVSISGIHLSTYNYSSSAV